MKKVLTLKDAEKLLLKYSLKEKNNESKEFRLLHSKNVAKTAISISKKKSKNIDRKILKIAALVHDIGYAVSKENHPIHSVKLLENEGYIVEGKLRDCILNHGASSFPKTEEGKIFQLADKIDIFNPNILSIIIKYNSDKIKDEDLDFLESMTKKSVILLSKYNLK